jgi:hypothetical protein
MKTVDVNIGVRPETAKALSLEVLERKSDKTCIVEVAECEQAEKAEECAALAKKYGFDLVDLVNAKVKTEFQNRQRAKYTRPESKRGRYEEIARKHEAGQLSDKEALTMMQQVAGL